MFQGNSKNFAMRASHRHGRRLCHGRRFSQLSVSAFIEGGFPADPSRRSGPGIVLAAH